MNKILYFTILLAAVIFLPGNVKAATVDSDDDGLSDEIELALGTATDYEDSDFDGYSDSVEVMNGYNPLKDGKDRNVKRRVEVNLSTQSLDYFVNDVKIGTILVSTGVPKTPTPKGEFSIIRKRPIVNYFNYPNTKWSAEFTKGYYIHGAYWHDQFGIKTMSGGCVNVAYKDMEALYTFLSLGDKVKIFGTPPGKPLTLTKK